MKARLLAALLLASSGLSGVSAARAGNIVVDFEDLGIGTESFDNGSSGAGGFVSQGAFFSNLYDQQFQVWSGWAASTITDNTTPGFTNQYSAFPGSGAGGSATYAMGFSFFPNDFDPAYFDAYIDLPDAAELVSIDVTNSTYAALSMANGDQFAKKFGGTNGTDPDFFLLTITGFDEVFGADGYNQGNVVGIVEFYLADFRFDASLDHIVDEWITVNLGSLQGARSLGFSLTSSDVGQFGMNTPGFFAVDNLRLRSQSVVPEPASCVLFGAGLVMLTTINRRRKGAKNTPPR